MRPAVDPRSIITPYAFNIAPKLLNRPLASPWRRGLALAVDLLMVAILAELPVDMLLAIVLAVAWIRFRGYRIKSKLQTGVFIGFGLWLLFAIIHATVEGWPDEAPPPAEEPSGQTLVLDGICEEGDAGCVLRVIADVTAKVVSEELSTEDELTRYLTERYGLSEELARELAVDVMSDDTETPSLAERTDSDRPPPEAATETLEHAPPEPDQVLDDLGAALEKQAERESVTTDERQSRFSIIEVMKGIVEDLGLGLGWASVYFTVFTAWFHGQTLGKKLLAIRVIQLDNTPLSLWDAFGRYGGYGAGLATGLTGFLQIFWDPNRQGIHDKIASTVVVDLRAKARKRARAMSRQITTIDMKEPNG